MEKSALNDLFNFDKNLRLEYGIICGIDEAGRGPLAGDVFAAAVVLDGENPIEGINDSKKLTEKKRELLFDEICQKALAFSIARASVREIEELNILNASMLAMKRAFLEVMQKLDINLVLIDGNRIPEGINCETRAVIKGDAISESIAAASILAKVSRDRYAVELDKIYPQYEFARHKGYGTKLHTQKILEFGPCEVHRKLFLRKILERKVNE